MERSNKIILAMIAGNEEAVLPRCVESFAGAVDGLVVCWARGAQAPDDSEARVRAVCDRLGLPVVFTVYENGPAARDWPHVDDFAAARNKAYLGALAFGEMSKGAVVPGWLLWADADDVLVRESVRVVREMAERDDASVLFFPYVLDANGGFTKRERMGRVEVFHEWTGAVHERIVWRREAVQAYVPEVQVVHLPEVRKSGSHERNVRILEAIPMDERTGRDFFYLYSEYSGQHRIPEAMAAGVEAVGREDLLDEEKYPIYLTMGKWIGELVDAERPILEALRLMPGRREAYGELARLHLSREDGVAEKALGYLRAMAGVPLPDEVSIWHNPGLYGWEAEDLLDVALWRCGKRATTEGRRRERFRANGRRISVVHRVDSAEQAAYLRGEWLQRAMRPEGVEWIFVVAEACPRLEAWRCVAGPVADGVRASSGRVLVFVEDDMHAPQGWDGQVWEALKGHGAARLVLRDGSIDIRSRQAWGREDVRLVDGAQLDFARSGREVSSGVRISVAHPTCRPERALEVRKMWLERARFPERVEYVFGTEAGLADRLDGRVMVSEGVPEGFSSAVVNYNAAAAGCSGEIVIAAQDDIYPPMGWDVAVADALVGHLGERRVLHVHDGFRSDGLMVIMCVTRRYLDEQGWLLCPEYDGYWSDTEFSWRAYQEGIVVDGRHIRFFHDHPAFTGAASDEEYRRQSNPVANARGEEIFRRRNPECKW